MMWINLSFTHQKIWSHVLFNFTYGQLINHLEILAIHSLFYTLYALFLGLHLHRHIDFEVIFIINVYINLPDKKVQLLEEDEYLQLT